MSQERLVRSNHYVVRIYPRILPPFTLFPSLHPSRLFPSLCCWRPDSLTTLNILWPLFLCGIMHHLSSLVPETHSFVGCLFVDVFGSAPCLVCHAAAHINRFVLEMYSGTNRVSVAFSVPSLCIISASISCAHTFCMNVCVCMHSSYKHRQACWSVISVVVHVGSNRRTLSTKMKNVCFGHCGNSVVITQFVH